MKSLVCTFAASLLLCVPQAGAIGHGWSGYAGFNYGFNYHSCDFANSLWEGYCSGGPCAPPACCAPCGIGCHSGAPLQGCHGASGCAAQGSAACCGSAEAGAAPCGAAGCGAFQGCCGAQRPPHPGPWWYGYSPMPRTSCGWPGKCHGLRGARYANLGGGECFNEACRHAVGFRSWVGGGPLDGCGLVPGYGFAGGDANLEYTDAFGHGQHQAGDGAPQPPGENPQGSPLPPDPAAEATPLDENPPQEEILPPAESFSGENSIDESFFN